MNQYLNSGRLWRLCQKELRESLRDRRTIFTLVLMPILVYPLLSMALQRLIIGGVSKGEQERAYVIGTPNEETAYRVQRVLAAAKSINDSGFRSPLRIIRTNSDSEVLGSEDRSEQMEPKVAPNESTAEKSSKPDLMREATRDPDSIAIAKDDIGFVIQIIDRMSPADALKEGILDLAIGTADEEELAVEKRKAIGYSLRVDFRQGDVRSEGAMNEFRRAMQLLNDQQSEAIRQRVATKLPFAVTMSATGIGQKVDAAASIAGVIPLVLILMTITGAVYPAIDLTAGERERGTMEALIATPAPRFALLLSKYVAVVSVAILTALANLFATWLTLSFGGLGQAIFGKQGFSLWTLLQILPLLVIFACFFSAILLALCSFARSFKEAQAYLIPVMLLSLGPGLVTLMPNVKFTSTLSVVPLVNILLLSRDIMTGTSTLVPAFVAVFSTIIYAGATLVIAARLFGAEAATSGSQESWGELLGRQKKERLFPSIGELFIYLSMLFPIFFVTSNLGSMFQLKGAVAMWFNALLLMILFLMLPIFFSWYRRLNLGETFRWRFWTYENEIGFVKVTRWIGYLASVACFCSGLWMVAFEAYLFFESWSISASLSEEDRQKLKETFLQIPFWMVLVTGAVIPAIAEEFFFRGFVLSAFRSKLGPLRSVAYTAVLFGLFQVIAGSILSLEKFLPTLILGLAVGWIAVKTRSIWPGILLHAIHNGLVFSLTRYTEQDLAKWFGTNSQHIPIFWLIGGALGIVLGTLLMWVSSSSGMNKPAYSK
jgi:sodium transport system permease protein